MRKNRIIALFIMFILLFSPTVVNAASNISIDSKNAAEGVVRVSYAGIDKKTKVMVEKGSTRYYYDLKKEEDFFPLQLGQGQYTVAVMENISGTKYKVVAKKSFKANISEENLVYLKSTQPIVWNENMEAIKLAKSLTQNEEDDLGIVKTIYDYIVDNIDYDYKKVDKLNTDYTPDIDEVLREGKGICYDYSVLFGAMLRSRNIPTKLVKGYREGLSSYHSWNEVYLNGSWKIIDTTYDAATVKAGTSSQMFKDKSHYNKLKEY